MEQLPPNKELSDYSALAQQLCAVWKSSGPFITAGQCVKFIQLATERGFARSPHDEANTVDQVSFTESADLLKMGFDLYPNIARVIGDRYGCTPLDLPPWKSGKQGLESNLASWRNVCNDIFVSRYCYNRRLRGLVRHRDGSAFSFIVVLDGANCGGGGTLYANILEAANTVVQVPNGHLLIHCGQVTHGAKSITSGIRIILAGFVKTKEHPGGFHGEDLDSDLKSDVLSVLSVLAVGQCDDISSEMDIDDDDVSDSLVS